MAFKMKGSAFKLGNVATKSALKTGYKKEMDRVGDEESARNHAKLHKDGYYDNDHNVIDESKDPDKEEAASALKQVVDIAGRQMDTKGRGKRTRYNPDKLIPGRAQWIRDNFGTGLSRRERMKAHIAYYNANPPQETVLPEKEEIIYPDPEPKETRYPTNKDIRGSIGFQEGSEQVWDETVNKGEGGYVKVDSQGRKEYEEGYNLNPSKKDMEIPDESSKYSL